MFIPGIIDDQFIKSSIVCRLRLDVVCSTGNMSSKT